MLKKIMQSQKEITSSKKVMKRMMTIIIFSLLVMLLISSCSKSTKPDNDFSIDETGIVTFGGEKWIVLDRDDDKLLLISQFTLFNRRPHDTWEDVTWETSHLRAHLNGAFYNSFNDACKAMILPVTIENLDSQWYGTNGGNDTEDKIFVLSLDEVCTYWGTDELLNNPPWPRPHYINDEFNHLRVAKTKNGNPTKWWLRSPGVDNFWFTNVNPDGHIDVYGDFSGDMDSHHVGVRPVMWISRK